MTTFRDLYANHFQKKQGILLGANVVFVVDAGLLNHIDRTTTKARQLMSAPNKTPRVMGDNDDQHCDSLQGLFDLR